MAVKSSFFQLMITRAVVRNSLKVSLVVGSILATINHGSAIANLDLSLETGVKIIFNYIVPYCVSSYSAVKTIQSSQ
mgnify:CR=1 FL=1